MPPRELKRLVGHVGRPIQRLAHGLAHPVVPSPLHVLDHPVQARLHHLAVPALPAHRVRDAPLERVVIPVGLPQQPRHVPAHRGRAALPLPAGRVDDVGVGFVGGGGDDGVGGAVRVAGEVAHGVVLRVRLAVPVGLLVADRVVRVVGEHRHLVVVDELRVPVVRSPASAKDARQHCAECLHHPLPGVDVAWCLDD